MLKHSPSNYQTRLTQFLELMIRVRALAPNDHHLWQIMDMPCFEDTETALETMLYNQKHGKENISLCQQA